MLFADMLRNHRMDLAESTTNWAKCSQVCSHINLDHWQSVKPKVKTALQMKYVQILCGEQFTNTCIYVGFSKLLKMSNSINSFSLT